MPTHSHYLNEEVNHICVTALYSVHKRTLATFDILSKKRTQCRENLEDTEMVKKMHVMV